VSDSITKEHYIHVGPVSLQANFVADTTLGLKPLTVHFTDLTIGSPTQWNWNFGDGGFAIDQNPTHTYTAAGTYTVTLTDRNAEQTSTLTKPSYITVTSEPTPPPVDPSKIVLKHGWNFVSTPKILASGYNTGSIFANVDMGGRSAWIWNGAMSPPQWVPITSTTPIQPLWGIWIYSNSNVDVTVNLVFDTNSMTTPPSRSLPAGWNGIGFTGSTQQTARNTYLSVQPNWTTSMGFNAITQQYGATIFNDDPTELTMLYPTKGYWLYMRTPGNLAAIGA
jgi:PKD repeat protein